MAIEGMDKGYVNSNSVGVDIKGTDDMVVEKLAEENSGSAIEIEATPIYHTALAGHLLQIFRRNKDARRNSGIEQEIIDSHTAYIGEYSSQDMARIKYTEQGSQIFMNVTATKCRAAASWFKDILLAAKEKAWSFEPTPSSDIPLEIKKTIEEQIEKEFNEYIQASKQNGEGGTSKDVSSTIRETNQNRRDILDAITIEIEKEAKYQARVLEKQVEDQLEEGGWDKALSDFIEDFTVYPAAFMKGPVISKKKKLHWVKGKRIPVIDYVFLNKRVSAFDMYPSPSQTDMQDGDLVEHIRLTRKELNALMVPGYKKSAIHEVLDKSSFTDTLPSWLDTAIEGDKAFVEKRGTEWDSNIGIFHGLHGHITCPVHILKDWGMEDKDV